MPVHDRVRHDLETVIAGQCPDVPGMAPRLADLLDVGGADRNPGKSASHGCSHTPAIGVSKPKVPVHRIHCTFTVIAARPYPLGTDAARTEIEEHLDVRGRPTGHLGERVLEVAEPDAAGAKRLGIDAAGGHQFHGQHLLGT